MSNITYEMAQLLLSRTRTLEWIFWIESDLGDLWTWSGGHNIEWNGQVLTGVGPILSFKALNDVSNIEHKPGEYMLSGIDPSASELIDRNVRGKKFKHWMCGIVNGAVVRDPILVRRGLQDQVETDFNEDGTINIRLVTFEAVPFINKAPSKTITHEGQLAKHPTDAGFALLTETALRKGAVDWQQA